MTDQLPLALQPRPFSEVHEILMNRARALVNPCRYVTADEVEEALSKLDSTEPAKWAKAFSDAAAPHEEKAVNAEAIGDTATAMSEYLAAYDYYHIGRFPTINSAPKLEAYGLAKDNFLKASQFFDPPLERILIPFKGREGEGDSIPAYFRRPKGSQIVPIVVSMGGIDGFKEERDVGGYLRKGVAALTMDMPGVGESPLKFGTDSERLFDPVFDWICARADLDSSRIAVVGNSFGGYWAAKLAHTHKDQLTAVVAHGGPMHYMFTEESLHVKHAWYAFELYETSWYAMGISGLEEWRQKRESLDMVNLGIIGTPAADLLCVNGVSDISAPPSDTMLFAQNEPRSSAWLFPGGHMGTGDVRERIGDWVIGKLSHK